LHSATGDRKRQVLGSCGGKIDNPSRTAREFELELSESQGNLPDFLMRVA
jgi:hypothetical protein